MATNDNPRRSNIETGAAAPALPMVVVYATFPSRGEAVSIGRAMVEARVAGCVNVIPGMTSVYIWEGETQTAEEAILIAKLPARAADAAIAFIAERHNYDTPAILVLPVEAGLDRYLSWIARGVDVGQPKT